MKRIFGLVINALLLSAVLVACATPTPQIIEKEVVVTQVVKETVKETVVVAGTPQVVEKEVTKVVEKEVTPTPVPSGYKESPMLTQLVQKGELPPVEQRLPADPLVVEVEQRTGTYGGTLRFADPQTSMWSTSMLRHAGLFRYNQPGNQAFVDMARSYHFSEDLKTVTIELRRGLKWSDGAPLTVDDIMFVWEDVLNNKELSPAGPGSFWTPGGEVAIYKKLSDTELQIQFAVPYPVVIDRLARTWFSTDPNFFAPKHYLQQYHIDYNPKANELAQSEGYDDWTQAFNWHKRPSRDAEDLNRPWCWAWIPEQVSSDRIIFVRNPYFHQVDPEGNQLPYIDRIDAAAVADDQVMTMKASAGELDFEVYYLKMADAALFEQNKEQGNYRVLYPISLSSPLVAFGLNRTVKDPVLNELFNNKDFRIALSVGIDREAFNKALYFGRGTPLPTVPALQSFFQEEWADVYMEYDPDRANEILDSLGLVGRDADGYRLRPDGERLSILAELTWPGFGPKIAGCEIVASDYKKLGIDWVCTSHDAGSALIDQRNQANDTEVIGLHVGRNTLFGRASPFSYAWQPSGQYWGYQWALWFESEGELGVEPPQEIKDLKAVWDQYVQTVPGTPEFDRLGEEYFQYFVYEVPIISTVQFGPVPLVVSNRLHNVPEEGLYWDSDTNFYAPYLPEQWFIEE